MKPALYTQIQQKQLEKLLKCLHSCLELPILVLDETGAALCGYGLPLSFCQSFKKLLPRHSSTEDSCQKLHAESGKRAMKSGVPFIFSCHANLRHLSFPLNSGRQPLGALLIGPFLTEAPDPEMFVDISERYSPGARELLKLYKEAGEIPIISPERAEQISWLISYLFTPFLSPDASASQDAAGYSEEEDDAVSKKGRPP